MSAGRTCECGLTISLDYNIIGYNSSLVTIMQIIVHICMEYGKGTTSISAKSGHVLANVFGTAL